MAHKYLTGTATFTAATRTVSAATMNTAFVLADQTYQRQVFFRIGTTLYFGRVEAYISATSVKLLNAGELPAIDGTIDDLLLYDLSEAHTYQGYLDKIGALIKDDAAKLSAADIAKMLAQAVSDYSIQRPLIVRKKITGNGTASYLLSTVMGSLWVDGHSYIQHIEYPITDTPAVKLLPTDWEIYDDGTAQDGTNKVLRFVNDQPSATEYFIIQFIAQISLPSAGVQNFPNTDQNFANITLLAAAYCCNVLAAAYAQSSDTTISADVVNYHDKTSKYTSLARVYLKQYNVNVFGQEEPEKQLQAAVVDLDIDLDSEMGGGFIFHSGRNR